MAGPAIKVPGASNSVKPAGAPNSVKPAGAPNSVKFVAKPTVRPASHGARDRWVSPHVAIDLFLSSSASLTRQLSCHDRNRPFGPLLLMAEVAMTRRSKRLASVAAVLSLTACASAPTPQTEPMMPPASTTPAVQPATAAHTAHVQDRRAVRRDMPITNMMRRALEAGTRDSTGRPGRDYWQLRTDYSIRTRLDPATSTVTGSETVVIHNTSPSPMPFIVLRLDQNIFREDAVRASAVPEITGGMTISRMLVDGRAVVLDAPPARRGFGRDPEPPAVPTAIGLDQTVARIVLPAPIAPGAHMTLEIDWSFRVPRVEGGRGLRMGAWPDSLFQVAQWYPRVAKFDDLRGWDTEPYLGPSEFYNNFGSFDVRIDVPAGWIVGATGVLKNPEQVLTVAARERLARVLDSDETVTIVGADERGP
ncbi:MAG: hypothetical protein KFH98_01305, partial [Gemmatimonadetes bacterium]|nr:hypothetical protein [Gemmatimonadota bacterium]